LQDRVNRRTVLGVGVELTDKLTRQVSTPERLPDGKLVSAADLEPYAAPAPAVSFTYGVYSPLIAPDFTCPLTRPMARECVCGTVRCACPAVSFSYGVLPQPSSGRAFEIPTHLDHISHCKASPGTNWLNGWTSQSFFLSSFQRRTWNHTPHLRPPSHFLTGSHPNPVAEESVCLFLWRECVCERESERERGGQIAAVLLERKRERERMEPYACVCRLVFLRGLTPALWQERECV